MTSLSFFGFLANLERSGGWIPETESAKFMFSLTVDFCVAKNENIFEVSRIILTSFRQGGGGIPPHTPQNKPLKSPPRLGSARALSVTMVTIIADKGSFSSDQAYIKKW